jgi:hypothetical protein
VFDGTDTVFAPLLDGGGVTIDPVEMRLEVAIRAGDVSDLDGEEYVAIVVGPAEIAFDGLVMG